MTEDTFKRSEIFTISREITIDFEPFKLFRAIIQGENKPHGMLFESARTDDQSALKSMLVTKVSLRITALKEIVTVRATSAIGNNLLSYLINTFPEALIEANESAAKFRFVKDQSHYPRGVLTILVPLLRLKNPEFDPFIGGLFGYDLVGEFYDVPIPDQGRERDLCLYFAEEMIILDHKAKRGTYEHLYLNTQSASKIEAYRIFNQQAKAYEDLVHSLNQEEAAASFPPISSELSTGHSIDGGAEGLISDDSSLSSAFPTLASGDYQQSYPQVAIQTPIVSAQNGITIPDRDSFAQAVDRFIDQIKAGKLLQIVPSRAFTLPCPDPFSSYYALKMAYPSPYLFYLHDEDFTLFGASPESALKYSPENRELELYPIAGTKKRGMIDGEIDLGLDLEMEAILRADKKEVAEHLMLVDLAKEDLSPISEAGSIHVKELMKIDRYRYVMHLVSRVSGTLKEGLSPLDAYLAVMNMGTLTGAPKVYAMKEIYQYETQARGSYGGAIGYIQGTAHGDRFDSAIVIRSAFVQNGVAKVQAGAGIVADSIAESEIEETENKASSVVMAILKSQQKAS